jgi:two-component system, sensor histidine kinase and response regulator
MTAYAMQGDRERCIAAGMDAYISKPINADELLRTIDGFVPTPAAAEFDSAGDMVVESKLNFSALIARADGNIDLARELVTIFLDEYPKHLSDIREAIERDDSIALEHAAHTAKGALSYFSSGVAVQAALRLQQMGVQGDLQGALDILADLTQSIEQFKPSLTEFGRAYA